MLYNGSEVIRDLEWVIFDEVHYINDAEVRNSPNSCFSPVTFFIVEVKNNCFPSPLFSSERGCVGGGFDYAS